MTIIQKEAVLLVGDTGCGKTTLAQHCAAIFNKNLFVYNMNQSSDAIDLIGGFKPIDIRILLRNLLNKFIKRFTSISQDVAQNNKQYIDNLTTLFSNKQYPLLLKTLSKSFPSIRDKALKVFQTDAGTQSEES